MIDVGVVIVRTSRVEEQDADELLRCASDLLAAHGCRVREVGRVGPDAEAIAELIAHAADRLRLPVLLTLGGTGLHPEDVTPDATGQVLHRPAPGIPEALRARVGERDPQFILTRGQAGVRGATLIVNLPDDLRQLELCLTVLAGLIPAAVNRLRPDREDAQLRLL